MRAVAAVAVTLSIALAGCSARQAYSTLQTSGRAHAACEAMQDAEQSARCEADFRKSYYEYERERREVLAGANAPAR